MHHYERNEIINIGVGKDISIRELANLIKKIVGYDGDVQFDPSKPDGTPRKLLDVSRLNSLGWHSQIPLEEGIARTYQWYLEQDLAKTRS
jgi:GDP-L-fucose synthase